MVVPQSSDAKPIPSEVTRRLVCQHLDERRLITTQLRVAGPLYHDIDVDVDLVVMSSADLKTVKNAVAQRLADYFHPLRGGVTAWVGPLAAPSKRCISDILIERDFPNF